MSHSPSQPEDPTQGPQPRRPVITPEMMEDLPFPLEHAEPRDDGPEPVGTASSLAAGEQQIVDEPTLPPEGGQAHAVMFIEWVRALYRYPADALREINNYQYLMGIDGKGPQRTVEIMLKNPRFFGELRDRALNVLAERVTS